MDHQIEAFWQEFLHKTGRPMDTPYYEAFYFGLNEGLAKELGYTFTEDMLVLFEDFEVVYKKDEL